MVGHRRLLNIGSLLRIEHRLGLVDDLGEVQRAGGDLGFAAGRPTVQRMPRQTTVPASRLRRIERCPQRLTAVTQGLGQGRVEHVQRRRGGPLPDCAFDAADPERKSWVLQAAVGGAVGFAAIDQGDRADDPAVLSVVVIR